MKNIIKTKSRYERWDKFLSENNIKNYFDSLKIDEKDSYAEIANRIINDLSCRPNCRCGKEVKFHQNHYQEFCSVSCQTFFNTNKRLKTYKNNTGYSHPHKNPEVRKGMMEKCQENFGVEHQWQSEEIRNKADQTKLIKYGFKNYNNVNQIMKTREKRGYKLYDYTLPSGKIVKYQGYENKYIPVLIRKFGESNIIFETSKIPKIKYMLNEKYHYYFPDFYIPSENLIIEIKSKYTMNADFDKNIAKFNAVKESGYNFKLKIY